MIHTWAWVNCWEIACKNSTWSAEHVVGSLVFSIFLDWSTSSSPSADKTSANVGASLAGNAYSISSS